MKFFENLQDYNPIKKRIVFTLFDDMITDMEGNKEIKSYCYWIVFMMKKGHEFTCFYIAILFQGAWNCKTKCNTLFYHESS